MNDLAHAVMTEIALREEVRLLRETEAALRRRATRRSRRAAPSRSSWPT